MHQYDFERPPNSTPIRPKLPNQLWKTLPAPSKYIITQVRNQFGKWKPGPKPTLRVKRLASLIFPFQAPGTDPSSQSSTHWVKPLKCKKIPECQPFPAHHTLCSAIIEALPIRYIGVGKEKLKISSTGSRELQRTWNQPTTYPQATTPNDIEPNSKPTTDSRDL